MLDLLIHQIFPESKTFRHPALALNGNWQLLKRDHCKEGKITFSNVLTLFRLLIDIHNPMAIPSIKRHWIVFWDRRMGWTSPGLSKWQKCCWVAQSSPIVAPSNGTWRRSSHSSIPDLHSLKSKIVVSGDISSLFQDTDYWILSMECTNVMATSFATWSSAQTTLLNGPNFPSHRTCNIAQRRKGKNPGEMTSRRWSSALIFVSQMMLPDFYTAGQKFGQ